MKKIYFFGMMLLAASFTFVSCDSDDDNRTSDIPADNEAGTPPVVTENTVTIPNMSAPYIEEGSNGTVGNISFTGVKGTDGNYINLVGTDGGANQNIWLTIDGKQKSIKIVNAGADKSKKSQADVVFLIDDSGSMDEEADSVAAQVVAWSKVLAQVVDTRFGVVGYGDGYYGIDGAMDMNVIDSLDYFMNSRERWGSPVYGVYRTMGFWGNNAEKFESIIGKEGPYAYNGYGSDECGALALHFADEQFSFRDGANRIYLNFTDEPNQPYGTAKWSVESVNPQNAEMYDWTADRGTIHTIFSEDPTWYAGYWDSYNECPWLMSDYTGGTKIFAPSNFKDVSLGEIEVTGAITSTYIVRFNITPDLHTGQHTLTITIKDKNGQAVKQASMTFTL